MRQRFKLLIVTFETFAVGLLACLVLGFLGFTLVVSFEGAVAGPIEEIVGIFVFAGSGLAMHRWFDRRWRRRADNPENV